MLSRRTLRRRFAPPLPIPPLPKPLPPLPRPEPPPLPSPLPSRLLPCHTVRSDAPVTTKICRTTRHTGRGQPEVGESTAREQQREAMRERQRKRAEATSPACRHDSPFSVRLVSWMRRVTTPAGRRVCGKGKTRAAAESQLDWTRVRSRRRKGRGRRAHARLRWTEGRRVACVCLEGERLCAGVPS